MCSDPAAGAMAMNKLYFGDNLDVLREKVKDESVRIERWVEINKAYYSLPSRPVMPCRLGD
jgi:hypothetical protein